MYTAVDDDNYCKEDGKMLMDTACLIRNINFYKENLPKEVNVDLHLSQSEGGLFQYFFLNVSNIFIVVLTKLLFNFYSSHAILHKLLILIY